jgi:hypothetical protein
MSMRLLQDFAPLCDTLLFFAVNNYIIHDNLKVDHDPIGSRWGIN